VKCCRVDAATLAALSDQAPETLHGMLGRTPAMRSVSYRIERFARLPIPVLILGESGTGKELAARAISRIVGSEKPFVVVSCAAIPPTLIESELFGHERGAFTGAVRRHTGLLAQADGGILFLDEVAELPLHAQAKLLRAIETQEYRLVGGEVTQRSRFRVIAATHRDIDAMVRKGEFRDDLVHRLGAARIVIPPLRERLDDLPLLAERFLCSFREAKGDEGPVRLTRPALELLRRAEWPGNVRQLRNVIEAAAAMAAGNAVEPQHLAEFLVKSDRQTLQDGSVPTLADAVRRAEHETIRRALERAEGDRALAARWLGISLATLYRKVAQLDGAVSEAVHSRT